MRRFVALFMLLATFALPGVAGAQSAGDEQYQDPFAGGGDNGQQQSEPPADEGSVVAQSDPVATEETATATAELDDSTLPVTGAPIAALAALGAGLLAGGALLRHRT